MFHKGEATNASDRPQVCRQKGRLSLSPIHKLCAFSHRNILSHFSFRLEVQRGPERHRRLGTEGRSVFSSPFRNWRFSFQILGHFTVGSDVNDDMMVSLCFFTYFLASPLAAA